MLANCAMMNIPPSEAKKLSLWEYETLLFHWNEAHAIDDEVAPPDRDTAMAVLEHIRADPRLVH